MFLTTNFKTIQYTLFSYENQIKVPIRNAYDWNLCAIVDKGFEIQVLWNIRIFEITSVYGSEFGAYTKYHR